VEEKGASLTFHYRQAQPAQHGAVAERARASVREAGFQARDGLCSVEARPPIGWDKGRAVLHLLRAREGPAWSERVSVVYVGDDDTDEDAFRALVGLGITFRHATPTLAAALTRRGQETAALAGESAAAARLPRGRPGWTSCESATGRRCATARWPGDPARSTRSEAEPQGPARAANQPSVAVRAPGGGGLTRAAARLQEGARSAAAAARSESRGTSTVRLWGRPRRVKRSYSTETSPSPRATAEPRRPPPKAPDRAAARKAAMQA
jgi:hypothetical protein